ncbi:serine/threonine-protein kinase Chk2-like [Anneissia japonica]|uniref:serine/threonine-protein kinase Chk2-like n=1 Tax=Anneissia japonica TaxID=1529436 RepID=UPI0014258FF1|nr:serine/threonine-protein kinase Chk2-like [Anneissia japonica]XP_033115561.1 serine/threonine-protein kinase Chk2-like [Anneissia japonica]XP_033115568.1 serine/threonine-protein kinase Chk2-like [Anneissia japonica]
MSSGDPNTSSSYNSASTGATMSSADTVPTQDIVDCGDVDGDQEEEEEEEPEIWGRLFPFGAAFTAVNLSGDKYTVGRDKLCDICLDTKACRKLNFFATVSKIHFNISKDKSNAVFIEDQSSNGTFLNGQKIGKSNKRVLKNNDLISLSVAKNKAYVFMDTSQESLCMPEEMKKKYTLSRTIGRGACGEVRLAFENEGSQPKRVAVKIIEKKTFSTGGTVLKDMGKKVMDEVDILKSLEHPCIIKIEDVFDTPDVLFIILELVEGGELFDKITSKGKLTESHSKLLFFQMVTACKYLHDKGITHRDLKPENILLSSEEDDALIKVTDFGLSKFVGENSFMKTLCGTPTYLAPEILKTAGMGGYSKAVDLWSLGVILFICLSGYPPFSEQIKVMTLHQQITRGHYSFPNKYWSDVSKEAIDLIKKLMTVDPKRRLTINQVLDHPWLDDKIMKEKACKLMGIATNGMPPPNATPKKRPREEENDGGRKFSRSSSGTSDSTDIM